MKTGSRGTGQSAAAKYDYISRAGKYEAACQDEVVHLESGSMPSFASSDARLYWAAADSHERSNGRLFRSLTAALPNSLDFAGRLALARSFAEHVTAGQLPYTLALHAGLSKEAGVADNPHLHLVFSERVNDGVARAAEQWFRRAAPKGGDPASGGARKSERTKPRAWLEETRQAWAAEMNLAFDRAGVADRVTSESHAAQLARAREAGDAAAEERLLLNPPSAHIGPTAKHRWEDRSSGAPELKPDRYIAYEEASASAREVRLAHARDAAEAAEARSRVEALDAEIAALEAEQRLRPIDRRSARQLAVFARTMRPGSTACNTAADEDYAEALRAAVDASWRAGAAQRSIVMISDNPAHADRREQAIADARLTSQTGCWTWPDRRRQALCAEERPPARSSARPINLRRRLWPAALRTPRRERAAAAAGARRAPCTGTRTGRRRAAARPRAGRSTPRPARPA